MRISIDLQSQARTQDINTYTELANAADISPNTARRWWIDDPTLTRIETSVLITICNTLGSQPGDILKLED